MRPLSIELEGFFAYRDKARVDLEGVEYFSLEGPTGSGKSSLIDAMIFALYGKIPRLGGTSVAPAISAGKNRARVSLRFEAGGETYTATRQLERSQAGGARATEVRLENRDNVIASGASEVSGHVEDLLNLSYDDFTRTVVLPQGDFARFLTATPRERQELLRGLLGLDIYRTMAGLARNREQLASSQLDSARHRLEELDVPDEDEVTSAGARLVAIVGLAERIEEREEEIGSAKERVAGAQAQLEATVDARKRLEGLSPPPRLEELSGLLASLDGVIEAKAEELASQQAELKRASEELGQLPQVEVLDRHADLYSRLAAVQSELAELNLDAIRRQLETAEGHVVEAGKKRERALSDLDEARHEHAAHALAGALVAGDPCPVCRQKVERVPDIQEPSALKKTQSEAEAAEKDLEQARADVALISKELARAEAAGERLNTAREQLVSDLSQAAEEDAIADLRKKAIAARTKVETLEATIKELGETLARHERERSDLAEEQRSLGRLLMSEREKIADLKPPLAESEDVLVQWKELIAWRESKTAELVAATNDLVGEVEKRRLELEEMSRRLDAELAELDISAGGRPSVAVARAEEKARQIVRQHEIALEQSKQLRADITESEEKAALAAALARHLRADGFERWMMVGAIADLVSGANTILGELSESSYSLHSDDEGSFDIVDHRNADEIRPISTLSGGETFLVSLALALSLAETLAAGGGSNLDAIILDEGFGTLDEESLDVVAAVLENLTVSGLMVGIITHVRALATRAPVRFVVRKGPEGSHVEKRE